MPNTIPVPEGADRSRPSLETTKGEAEKERSAPDGDSMALLGALRRARDAAAVMEDNAPNEFEATYFNGRASAFQEALALTGSAGELVRLRDSQQEDLEAPQAAREALERLDPIDDETRASLYRMFNDDALVRLARSTQDYYSTHGSYIPALARLALEARADGTSASSSSVSPSLTETDLGRGQTPPAPDGKVDS